MPDPLDLTGEIAAAIDGAALRGATLALAYVRDDLSPAVSFRGSTHVHSPTELALWARKRDSGLVTAIAEPGHPIQRTDHPGITVRGTGRSLAAAARPRPPSPSPTR